MRREPIKLLRHVDSSNMSITRITVMVAKAGFVWMPLIQGLTLTCVWDSTLLGKACSLNRLGEGDFLCQFIVFFHVSLYYWCRYIIGWRILAPT